MKKKAMVVPSPGIDILEISRVRTAARRYGHRFLNKIFTGRELRRLPKRNRTLYYALGFSFKEAIWKALPERLQKETGFTTIEIFWRGGRPSALVKGTKYPLLLTHVRQDDVVLAVAVLVSQENS